MPFGQIALQGGPRRDKLIDLFKTSALIQGLMALAGFGVICYLAIIGRPIPEILAALVGTIVGYYFGTKTKQAA